MATIGDTARPEDHSSQEQRRRPTTGRLWVGGWLLLIVAMASVLRFGGISNVGIRFDDEGAYVGDARLWHRCARVLTDRQALSAVAHRDKAALKQRMDELGVDFGARYAKPSQGYTFLGAMAMFVVGDRPAALLMVNAAAGVLSVVVVYAIGATLFSRWLGLCAALFLAVSPYHLFYGRSAFADTTAGFFVLVGLWIWIVGIKRNWSASRTFGLSGIFLGYAVTCHYRCLYIPGVLVLADLLIPRRLGTNNLPPGPWLRNTANRWLWLAVGVATPAVVIELLFQAARLAASVSDSFLPVDTYFEAWRTLIRMVLASSEIETAREAVSPGHNTLIYIDYFVHWHGIVAALLTLIGLVVVVRKKGPHRIPALVVLTTLVLLVNQPYTVARAMSTAIPFLCLCTAAGLFRVIMIGRSQNRWKTAVAGVLLVLCLTPAIQGSLHLYRGRSSIADACAFIALQGPATVVIPIDTYHRSKYWLYLEGTDVSVLNGKFHNEGPPEAVVTRLRRDGVRWIIIDPQRWHFLDTPPGLRNRVFHWWEAMDDYLSRETHVAAEFPHMVNYCREFLAEGPGLTHLQEMTQQRAGRLRVYDLNASTPLADRGKQ